MKCLPLSSANLTRVEDEAYFQANSAYEHCWISVLRPLSYSDSASSSRSEEAPVVRVVASQA